MGGCSCGAEGVPPGSGVGCRRHGGRQRGGGGVPGLVAARGWGELPVSLAQAWLLCQAWHTGTRGQRAFAQGCGSCMLPSRHRGVFPLRRRHFQGRQHWGGSCRVPLAAQGTCLSFPFFGPGLYFLCPLQPGCQVGAVGCAGAQRAAQVAWWEARPVGRVLGMLSAVCEPSAPSQKGGSSHWGLARSICRAGGVCRAVEQGGYHRESSMLGNPREKGGGLGCAGSTGT